MNKQTQLKTFIDFNKMQNLENLSLGTKLLSLEDRRNGFSIVIEIGENVHKKKDYLLYYLVHDKNDFDELYRDIWCTPFVLKKFSSLNSLENQLKRDLKKLEKNLEEVEEFEGY